MKRGSGVNLTKGAVEMGKAEGDIEKKIEEVLSLEKWRSFVNGKVTGGLAVLDVLGIEKRRG